MYVATDFSKKDGIADFTLCLKNELSKRLPQFVEAEENIDGLLLKGCTSELFFITFAAGSCHVQR